MAMTMSQKILAAHAGLDKVEAGQLIYADVDLVVGNDITSPVAIHEFDAAGATGAVSYTHLKRLILVVEQLHPAVCHGAHGRDFIFPVRNDTGCSVAPADVRSAGAEDCRVVSLCTA